MRSFAMAALAFFLMTASGLAGCLFGTAERTDFNVDGPEYAIGDRWVFASPGHPETTSTWEVVSLGALNQQAVVAVTPGAHRSAFFFHDVRPDVLSLGQGDGLPVVVRLRDELACADADWPFDRDCTALSLPPASSARSGFFPLTYGKTWTAPLSGWFLCPGSGTIEYSVQAMHTETIAGTAMDVVPIRETLHWTTGGGGLLCPGPVTYRYVPRLKMVLHDDVGPARAGCAPDPMGCEFETVSFTPGAPGKAPWSDAQVAGLLLPGGVIPPTKARAGDNRIEPPRQAIVDEGHATAGNLTGTLTLSRYGDTERFAASFVRLGGDASLPDPSLDWVLLDASNMVAARDTGATFNAGSRSGAYQLQVRATDSRGVRIASASTRFAHDDQVRFDQACPPAVTPSVCAVLAFNVTGAARAVAATAAVLHDAGGALVLAAGGHDAARSARPLSVPSTTTGQYDVRADAPEPGPWRLEWRPDAAVEQAASLELGVAYDVTLLPAPRFPA